MQPSAHTAGTNTKRRTKRSNMVDRGMVSLLAAVEVASNHSPTASDRQQPMATPSRTPDEPRKGARVFTPEERASLETEYAQNKFPTRAMMVDFASQLSKPPEKVRTWFNNRRALDRKMGITVVRQQPIRHSPPDPSPSPEPASMPSPPASAEEPKPEEKTNVNPLANTPLLSEGGVMMTPDASRWLSKTTPIAPSRRLSVITPIPPTSTPRRTPSFARSHSQAPSSSSRPRLNPTRLRKVRLRLGANTELHGEGHPNEVGLEVKFLYGKKRLVYEWYCGKNYAEAAETGGPYAKIEINFDSLFSMAFERTRDGSVIRMVLSDSPTLFRQTEHNMHKFKVRAQQRQYQKANPAQFTEDVFAKDHQILLRSDEAARVKKTISESVPELAILINPNAHAHMLSDAHGSQNDRGTDTDSMSAGARTEPVTPALVNKTEDLAVRRTASDGADLITPRLVKLPSEPSSGKSDAPAPNPADDAEALNHQGNPDMEVEKVISSKPINSARRTPMGIASRAHVWETPTRSNVRRGVQSANETGAGSSSLITRSGGNAAFLFPAPAPWQSPATPFCSEAHTMRGANVNFWLSAGGPPSVGATPIVPTSGSMGTPTSGPLVRRALDFTPGDFRSGRATITPTAQGRKRRFLEINDENDPAVINKQARSSVSTPKKSALPPPPMPPPLPPPPPPPLPSPMQRANKVKEEPVKESPSGADKTASPSSAERAAESSKGAPALPR